MLKMLKIAENLLKDVQWFFSMKTTKCGDNIQMSLQKKVYWRDHSYSIMMLEMPRDVQDSTTLQTNWNE